jgi:hypothetical protein
VARPTPTGERGQVRHPTSTDLNCDREIRGPKYRLLHECVRERKGSDAQSRPQRGTRQGRPQRGNEVTLDIPQVPTLTAIGKYVALSTDCSRSVFGKERVAMHKADPRGERGKADPNGGKRPCWLTGQAKVAIPGTPRLLRSGRKDGKSRLRDHTLPCNLADTGLCECGTGQ